MSTDIDRQTLWLPPGVERTAEESWPMGHASDERSKGFYDQLVDSEAGIEVVTNALEGAIESGAQKATVRAVVDFGTLSSHLAETDNAGHLIEAAFPLATGNIADPTTPWLVYFGAADQARLDRAVDVDPTAIDDIWRADRSDRAYQEPADADLVTVFDEHELKDLGLIYAPTFDMDDSAVVEMLADPRMQIIARRVGGRIVSAAAYYKTAVQVEGLGEIRFAEVTEAATHPEHTGQGHYSACAREVVRVATLEGANVIFGECNGSDNRVHSAALKSGRASARLAAHAAGLTNVPGFLGSVVPISGEMRNLFPAFLVARDIE